MTVCQVVWAADDWPATSMQRLVAELWGFHWLPPLRRQRIELVAVGAAASVVAVRRELCPVDWLTGDT